MNNTEGHRKDYKHSYECPECQYEIAVFDLNSDIVKCDQCNTLFKAVGFNLKSSIIKKVDSSGNSPWSFIRIGQKFEYDKVIYYIIGRVTIDVFYTDLTASEDENGSGNSTYQEWFCKSEKGEEMSITEDSYGYYLSMPNDDIYKEDYRFRTIEEGRGVVSYFEGESSNYSTPGKRFLYKMFKGNFSSGTKHGVEYTDWNDPKTHYTYIQEGIVENDLIKIFEKHNDLEWYKIRKSNFSFLRGSLIVCALLCLIFLFKSTNDDNGKKIFESKEYLIDVLLTGKEDESQYFEVEDLSDIYQLEISVKLNNNKSDVFTSVELLDENQNVINLFLNDFYYYYGYDGGEHWKEESQEAISYYNFEKKGKYHVRLFTEKAPTTVLNNSDILKVRVRKGSLLSRYFIGGFVFFAIMIFFFYSEYTKWYLRDAYFRLFDKIEKLFS